MKNNDAVVLLSGGLDSCVTLYAARAAGFAPGCLIFDYGQRHKREVEAAKKIARRAKAPYHLVKIRLAWGGSALLDKDLALESQEHKSTGAQAIPSTYVPARNIIFLSFALSYAESIGARAIFIGAHTQDYSGYPDCRPEFYRAFHKAALHGTRAGAKGRPIKIFTPLIGKDKAGIIRLGKKLGAPLELTWSCYQGGESPCGVCDSCFYRAKGFKAAGLKDKAR
jgi:7-cyano-7-deazaguanine synthase